MKFFLRDEADESVRNEIFKLREYRAADEAIKNASSPILDVGAHAGFFSLYCRSLNSKVKIFAIEPEPNNIVALQKHLKENAIKGVSVAACALAGKSGRRELALAADSHNHALGGPTKNGVPCFSLADFFRRYKIKSVSLLKMDIEGGEFEVLDGATAGDLAMVKNVILEYHNNNFRPLEQKLRESGFGVSRFPSKFDKKMGFLFARNKRYVSPSLDSGG